MSTQRHHVPADPLGRFVEIFERLEVGRGWLQSAELLRHSALMLTSMPGDPRDLAARVTATAEELSRVQPWYERSSVNLLLAAQLMRGGTTVAAMQAEVERAGAMFRTRWRIRGGTSETLAILALAENARDGRVTQEQFARLVGVYEALEKDHPLLTQKSDWPLCALLAQTDGEPAPIARRVEEIFQGLRARGFGRGDEVQTAALVLFLQGDPPSTACAHFEALYGAFKASGLWMGTGDYDEIALLCFTTERPEVVLSTVERHRERISALSPKPGKTTSFALAAGTAQLELMRDAKDAKRLAETEAVTRIVGVLAAQRAMVAMTAGSAAAM